MTAIAVQGSPRTESLSPRRPLLDAAMLCIVAGSQWGMLMLAAVYLRVGRLESMTSPEAIAGLAAIVLAALVIRIRTSSPARASGDKTLRWLLAFIAVACVGELLRPDLRLGNVTTFVSIAAYYLVGSAIGHDAAERGGRIPLLTPLLFIYTVWYAVMLVFLARGDLGFFGVLPESHLLRLEFRDGFAATELPIYVGFQFPVLMYVIFATRAHAMRLWAAALTACGIALVVSTVSAAAMAALLLVLIVFLVAGRGLSLRSIGVVVVLVLPVALVLTVSEGLIESVREKLLSFAIGEGVRALIYAELVRDIIESPLGIGKGRFVETNDFSWLGEGVYPHQNLLGIGAELGLPALALFGAFAVSAVVRLARASLSRRDSVPRTLRMLAATVLAVFLYQQFRGLFQDTWVIRETYFWLGMGLGALSAHAATSGSALEHSPR